MAVFTPVSEHDARDLLNHYQLGELVTLRGITAGIENTNYFLTTTRGEYVLTLFEVLSYEQLPFYIELMHHLAQQGLPVPQPQTRDDGQRLGRLLGKPSVIVSRLQGHYEPDPLPAHCALAGATMARMHLAGRTFGMQQPNLRGLAWWQDTIPAVLPYLDAAQGELIRATLDEQIRLAASAEYRNLPYGPAHCDLFRDNVLFDGERTAPQMGGVIDFYFAGCDAWLFDVAVGVNDWCIDRDSGAFDPDRLDAWLRAYAQVRPFEAAEHSAWPAMLRGAALRFWTSRLYDYHMPRPAQTIQPHDPGHFERVLRARQHVQHALPKAG